MRSFTGGGQKINLFKKEGDILPKTVDCFTRPAEIILIHEDPEVVKNDYDTIHKMAYEGKFWTLAPGSGTTASAEVAIRTIKDGLGKPNGLETRCVIIWSGTWTGGHTGSVDMIVARVVNNTFGVINYSTVAM